jgi:hypothetical protein
VQEQTEEAQLLKMLVDKQDKDRSLYSADLLAQDSHRGERVR